MLTIESVMKDKLARNEQKKMTVHEALVKIWDNRHEKSLNYAVNYATYGMELPDGEELKVQCLYVLNNMSRWRGPVAKEVRETLKAYSQRKGVK